MYHWDNQAWCHGMPCVLLPRPANTPSTVTGWSRPCSPSSARSRRRLSSALGTLTTRSVHYHYCYYFISFFSSWENDFVGMITFLKPNRVSKYDAFMPQINHQHAVLSAHIRKYWAIIAQILEFKKGGKVTIDISLNFGHRLMFMKKKNFVPIEVVPS